MKYLKSYKIFESDDISSLESTIKDITLDLSDEGYDVIVNDESKTVINAHKALGLWDDNTIRVKISSPRKESLYSDWKQDREDFAKKEYEKCKDVLDRIDDVMMSNGFESVIKNGFSRNRSGDFIVSFSDPNFNDFDYGKCSMGYDRTGQWVYHIIYRKKNINEGIFSNRKWWFQKGKMDPDRVFDKNLKMDLEEMSYDLIDSGFKFDIRTPDPSRVKHSREISKNHEDPMWYEKSIQVEISKKNSFYIDELIDHVIFMMSFLKDKWDLELRAIVGKDRTLKMFKYTIDNNYFDKGGLRKDKRPSLFRTGLSAYNEDNLRKEVMNYFSRFGDSIVDLNLIFKID